MADPLIAALRSCCVQVRGARLGTGFFVAPTTILTCAHLIGTEMSPGDPVQIDCWAGGMPAPHEARLHSVDASSDRALLRVPQSFTFWAPLEAAIQIGDRLVGLGFPERSQRRDFDQFSVELEGETLYLPSGSPVVRSELKFKAGQVEPGFSGGPVLSLGCAAVIGMTIATRGRSQATGGYAIPAARLIEYLEQAGVERPPPPHWPRLVNHETLRYRGAAVPFQAPPVPAHFIQRTELTDTVSADLVGEGKRDQMVAVALHGTGGIGKSTLAAAIAGRPEIRERYPDGVLWTELGQAPQGTPKLAAWAVALGGASAASLSSEACTGLLRTALHDKACLLVVDNVWEAHHLRPFLVGGPACAVLLTTRRANIADEVGASVHSIGDLSERQALDLVRRRAPALAWQQQGLMERVAGLLARVEGIALAVELVGGMLNRGLSPEEIAQQLARPTTLRGVTSTGRRTLQQCFNLSLDFLKRDDEVTGARFIALGITRPGARLTAPACATLWDTDASDAHISLWRLVDDALVSRSGGELRLHDMLRELASDRLAGAASIEAGQAIAGRHRALVQRYAAQVPNDRWDLLPDDGYSHANLLWHVVQSTDTDQARRLLRATTPDGQLAWYVAREQRGERADFIADLRLALRLFADEAEHGVAAQLFCALVLASLRSAHANLSPTVLEALVAHGTWSALTGFFGVLEHERDTHGIELLTAFARGLDQRRTAAGEEQLIARLRQQAVDLSLSELQTRLWSRTTAKLLGAVLALVPPEVATDHAKLAMQRSTDTEGKLAFLEALPSGLREFFEPAVEREIDNIGPARARVRMLSRMLAVATPSRRSTQASKLVDWLQEAVDAQSRARLAFGADAQDGVSSKLADAEVGTSTAPGVPDGQEGAGDADPFSEEFLADLELTFVFLPRAELMAIETLLARAVLGVGAGLCLHRLRFMLSLTERPATAQAAARADDALSRGKYQEAFAQLPQDPSTLLARFDQLIDQLPSAASGERVAAAWLPVWLKLDADEKRRSVARLRARFPTSLSVDALSMAADDPPSYDLPRLRTHMLALEREERAHAQVVCVSLENGPLAQMAIAELAPIDDFAPQAEAVVALMPYLPRGWDPHLIRYWHDNTAATARETTIVRVMGDLIDAIAAGALVDVLESSVRRESEWWLVEALTMTIMRLQHVEEFAAVLDASRHINALDLRVRLISRVAQRAADFGHFVIALTAGDRIPAGPLRWDHCRDLAQHLASVGHIQQAKKSAAAIAVSSDRSHAYALIVVELAAQGHWQEAEELAASEVTDPLWRNHATRILAHRASGSALGSEQLARRHQNRRRTEPSPAELRPALDCASDLIGDSSKDWTFEKTLADVGAEARRSALLPMWTTPIEGRTYLTERLAQLPRPQALKRLGQMAPLIGIISSTTVVDTIASIELCGRTWR